jgi:kelch-like protein 17 (actinfilin)
MYIRVIYCCAERLRGLLQVQELISNSQLNISSEEKVFTAVMNWVKHDLANRQQHVAQVGLYSVQ